MRNVFSSKIKTIFSVAKNLPFFSLDDLASLETDKGYLKVLLSRYEKAGKAVRLKKGLYVAKEYLEKTKENGAGSVYLEFLANLLYQPSYLSLDYILYKHNLLTEVPVNFTSVALKKTKALSNNLGRFFYRKVKSDLFIGFETVKEGGFTVSRATKAKALFDYLYLRKNDLVNQASVSELRLNLKELNNKDKKELKAYVKREGSKKMKEIFDYLF